MLTNSLAKSVAVGLAALGLSAALAATPAAASNGRHGAFAAGMIGGLAIGALAASATTPAWEPIHRDCWTESRPIYHVGLFYGYRQVRVCD
jgi:hypothetical protein